MKKCFQYILDYVEGRMPIQDFQRLFETDKSLQNTLKLPLSKTYTCYKQYNYNLFNLFKKDYLYKDKSWNTIECRCAIQGELMRLLDEYGIKYTEFTKYTEEYSFLLRIQPDYIDCEDDSILQSIIDSIPKDISKAKRVAIGKEKIKSLFKYDTTCPRWIQAAEWPIVNGKPLIFSRQERIKGDDCHTLYYFYDEETKEENVVEQFG